MKKGLILSLICIFGIVLLTGCGGSSESESGGAAGGVGGNQAVCSGSFEDTLFSDEPIKYTASMTATLDDSNKVKSVALSATFEKEEDANTMYSMYALVNQFAQDDSQKIDIKLNGKTMTISNYEVVMSDEEKSVVGMTKEEFFELAKSTDEEGVVTCR